MRFSSNKVNSNKFLISNQKTDYFLNLVSSPKAEPFKQWLAKVGYERLQEIQDPSLSIDRARQNWKYKGRSEKWVQQRITG